MDLDNIDDLSQEELMKLEDDLVAAETDGEADDTANHEPEAKPQESEGDNQEPAGEVKPEQQTSQAATEDEPGEKENTADDDLTKHVSPPSKWAEQRHAARQMREQLEAAEAKAARTDQLQEEFNALKEEIEALKASVQGGGSDGIPENPLDVFDDEKIEEIREDFGDEIANMFKATAAMLQKEQDGKQQQAAPSADDNPGQNDPDVDPDLLSAIEDNNELSYWQEKSPQLWERAVKMDEELLKDPDYEKLSFSKRIAKVVERVKADVMATAQKPGKTDSGNSDIPESMPGSAGVVPPATTNNDLDRILAADPEKQAEIYQGLSPAARDEVDKALNI
jgi:hypothetical protein